MSGRQSDRPPLPRWVDRYATRGLYGLLVGTGLSLLALVTNPVPDPSFPWATVPASLRLPVTQPRVEHWPVTYTVGIWLWVWSLPALFLAGYRRYHDTLGAAGWLVGLPTASMGMLTTYCRFFLAEAPAPHVERTVLHARLLAVLLHLRAGLE